MRGRSVICLNLFFAFAMLLGGVVLAPQHASAADLRGMLDAQAEENPSDDAAPHNGADVEGGDGFLSSLSDFLGNAPAPEDAPEGAPEGAQPQSVQREDAAAQEAMPDDADGDNWAAQAGFEQTAQDAYGRDEETYYEGQALEPQESDMFDDAFGADTVRAVPEEAQGPAPDDAPENFTQEGAVETQPLDAPANAGQMDIFGRPKDDGKVVEKSEPAADSFKFDLADLPPVNFKVPKSTTVTVRALDKITARMSEHKLKVNTPYNFGTLAIVMRTCVKSPPEETPEVKAFLQIADNRPEMEGKAWFSGWMFASSPAISALEHPVYDVWVIDCNIVSASADDDNR